MSEHKLDFADFLRRERAASARSISNLVKGLRVPEAVYRSWEAGERAPTRPEYARLCKQLPRMRHCRPVYRDAGPPPPPAARPPTFGAALRTERLKHFTQEELAELLDVTKAAVHQWEGDGAAPVREHYEALLDLFPALRQAPEPDWRDIPKPDGGRGVPRGGADDPPPSAPASAPPAPLVEGWPERLLRAALDVYGADGELRVLGADAAGWKVELSCPGLAGGALAVGATVDEACRILVWQLVDELDRRIGELQRVRDAVSAGPSPSSRRTAWAST